MKAIIEIITRVRALSLRLAALLLAAFTVGGAWAATLSYSGYISTDSANPTTVFSGVNLSDIGSTYVLKGNMGGGYVTSPGEAGVYRASLDNGVLTVQFQKIDGTSSTGIYAKGVVVKFQQSGDDITAYASATGYSSTLTLGQDYSSSTGTPASSTSANGYGIYDVSLVAGRKVEYKNTGTTSGTYTITGGYAAQPTWKLNIPAKGAATSGALVKVKAIKIGSRTPSWDADYDSASVTINGASSTPISTYATPYLLAYNSATTCKPLEYVFPDATPLMVNVGTDYDASFYKADGTQTSKNPGGSYLIKTADAVEYALRMPNVHSNGWRPVQEVETLVVATATASADANWSALTWTNGAADWTAAGATPVVLTVSDDCTVILNSNVSLESIVFDIADGKTLTLSGANTITAANGIIIKGGTVSVSAANLVGTVYGDGELKFVGIRPTTTATNPSLVLTDSAWEGTVTIQYNYENKATLTARQLFPQAWGSANSKIKWNGVAGYFGGCTSAAGWILEDLTVNDTTYPALRKNDGGSSSMTTAPSLSGSGTFADASNPTERFKFADGSSFAGSINITSSSGYGMNVQFGATAVDKVARTIHVLSGATVNVAANKTWAAPGGMVVAGTLTVGSGATVPTITTSDTAVYQLSSSATIGTVSGESLASSLFIISGMLTVSDTSVTSLKIPAVLNTSYYNGGTLNLSGCTSLTAVYLDLGGTIGAGLSLSNITLPAGCTVYAEIGSVRDMSAYTSLISGATYLVEETKAEYGAGSLTVENVPTGANVAVRRVDGTIVSATVEGTTATLTGEIKIDGAATLFDVTFTNTTTFANKPSGSASYVHNTGVYNNENADKSTGCMLYVTPWLGSVNNLTELPSFQNCMTLAVVGQMPAAQDDAMFIHLGGCASGYKGFLIARMAEDNKVRVAYNNGSTVTTLTTMTVPNASTARHAYVITKEDTASTTTFTIYLDGIKWKTVTLNSVLTISGGVQVGSDFHGEIHKKTQTDEDGVTQYTIKSLTSSASPDAGYATDTTGYVNCIRLYDRILTQAEINQYSDPSEYRYVSPNGSAVRAFTAANEDWIDETEGSDVWSNTKDEVTTTSGTPAAGAALTVNTETATTIGVNLAANTSYEAITVNGTGATFQFDGESTGAITVTGSSVIGAPTTIVNGALNISGGPVTMTEGGSLTFDYSNYEVASTTMIQLTGPIARNDSAVTITVPTNPYYTYTSGWDSGSEQYLITPTANAAVLIHGETPTGYATFAAALANAVSGDTIDLTANVSTNSLSFAGSLTLTSSSAVTLTASGSIVLPTAASTLSVNGVTLSPVPTTTVADSYVKATTDDGTTTYSVVAKSAVEIGEVTFEYSADYTKAVTVTAPVTGAVGDSENTWTLTVGERTYDGTYQAGENDMGTVTFEDVTVTPGSAFNYAIAADGHATGTTGAQSATAASVTGGWIAEDSTNSGTTGTWDPTITYSGTAATFAADSTNTFTATSQASGIVTLTTVINFGAAADTGITVDSDAKGAIRVAEESGNVFQLLTKVDGTSAWRTVSGATPDFESASTVEFTFDTAAQTYSVKVGENRLYVTENETSVYDFPFASAGDTIGAVTYIGAGTFTSLAGAYSTTNIMSSVDGANIVIPADFISTYLSGKTAAEAAVALAPNATDAASNPEAFAAGGNGINYFKCYALGLDPTKADDKPIVDVTVVDGNYVFKVKHPVYNEQGAIAGYEEIDAADNVTTTVTLMYGTGANAQSWTSAEGTSFAPNALPFGENNNVLYYKAEVTIDAK
ncbi:MAG: hypothetical protein IJ173_03970 [Kiritimatiellae bacterium]|nr:hypothetical protein [Kiritimatiellia bacterium]